MSEVALSLCHISVSNPLLPMHRRPTQPSLKVGDQQAAVELTNQSEEHGAEARH